MKRSLRAPPCSWSRAATSVPTEVDAILMGATRMIQKPGGPGSEEAAQALLAPVVDDIGAPTAARRARTTPVPLVDPGDRLKITRRACACAAGRCTRASARSAAAHSHRRQRLDRRSAVLTAMLRGLGDTFGTPVLVTQHMQSQHIGISSSSCGPDRARRAPRRRQRGHRAGRIYVAGGPGHLTLTRREGRLRPCGSTTGPRSITSKPAVDPLFRSVAEVCGPAAVGVVISGMGSDGAQGALAMRQRGAVVIAQDEATSAVWGMPGATVTAGAADVVAPAKDLADWVRRATQASAVSSAQGRR
ncbi:MAG: CheB methylesterase domain-containing protein [Polyangiales bacterium]